MRGNIIPDEGEVEVTEKPMSNAGDRNVINGCDIRVRTLYHKRR